MSTPEFPSGEKREVLKPSMITLLHWNVHFTTPIEDILAYLHSLRIEGAVPDIFNLQELTTDSPFNQRINVGERIAEWFGMDLMLGKEESVLGQKRFLKSDSPVRVRSGILSRLPIIDSQSVELSRGDFDYLYRDVDVRRSYVEVRTKVGERELVIANAHTSLPWFTRKQKELRRDEREKLARLVAARREKFVLTGDFNSSIDSYVVRAIQNAGLVRLNPQFERARVLRSLTHTLGKTLDHAFVTPDLADRIDRCELLSRGPSDHRPILLQLKI